MSGATKSFYAKEKVLDIIKKFNKGTISRICNQALLEYGNDIIDIKTLIKKIDSLMQEKGEIGIQIKELTRKRNILEKEEGAHKKADREILKQEKIEKGKQDIKNKQKRAESHIKVALEFFVFSKETALGITKEYMKLPRGERGGFVAFIESKGYKKGKLKKIVKKGYDNSD